ncbi:MAG: hypothetical protein MUC43_03285 [Pirellula sp.]|jgi:hypothetical protein|nr:hypothetical protein [Pirellula sp.]
MVAIQTIKNAYPPSFQMLCSTRRPNTGIYQFQEVDKTRLAELGIDLNSLSALQRRTPSTRPDASRLFSVSIHENKIREFETLMENLPVKKASELTPELRFKLAK